MLLLVVEKVMRVLEAKRHKPLVDFIRRKPYVSIAAVILLLYLFFWPIVYTVLVVVASVLSLVYIDQDELVYVPVRPLSQNPEGFQSPADLDLHFTNLDIVTKDNVKLSAWFVHPNDGSTPYRPTLIHFHGNSGNIGFTNCWLSHLYHELKANVVVVDYRGYGDSEGKPSEAGLMLDGRAVVDYVTTKLPIDRNRVYLWGASMGGAVVIALAEEEERRCTAEPSAQPRFAGLILENTFTSLWDIAPAVFGLRHPKASSLFKFILRSRWPSKERIESIKVPILILESQKDEIVPKIMGQALNALCDPRCRILSSPQDTRNDSRLMSSNSQPAGTTRYTLRDDADRGWYNEGQNSASPSSTDQSNLVEAPEMPCPGNRLPTAKHVYIALLRYMHSELLNLPVGSPSDRSPVALSTQSSGLGSPQVRPSTSPLPSPSRMSFSSILPDASVQTVDAPTSLKSISEAASIHEAKTLSTSEDASVLANAPQAAGAEFIQLLERLRPAGPLAQVEESLWPQIAVMSSTFWSITQLKVKTSRDHVVNLAMKFTDISDEIRTIPRGAFPKFNDEDMIALVRQLPPQALKFVLVSWTCRIPLPSAHHNDALMMEQSRYLQSLAAFFEYDVKTLINVRNGRRISKVEFVNNQAANLNRRLKRQPRNTVSK